MTDRLLLVVLCSAQLLIALDHNVVYVALPEMKRSLGFADGAEQWVVSAYALGFGGLLLLGGRLSDALGPRSVFRAGLAVHVVSAAAGAIATTPAALVAARAGQGLGSALLFPATLAVLNRAFEGRARAGAIAVWGAAGAFGGAFGSVIGGFLVAGPGWRSVLWATVPLAALGLVVAQRALPRLPVAAHGAWRQAPAAIAGTLAATLAVLALAERLAWPAAAAVAFVLAFRRLERRSPLPLVPGWMLRERRIGAGMLLAFAFMASFGGQFFLFTSFLHEDERLDPLAAGVAFLPLTLAILAGTQLGARVTSRAGAAGAAAGGFGAGALGMAACAMATAAGSELGLACGMVLDGLGQGVAWTGLWTVVAEGAGLQQGLANGLVATSQQLGGAAGLALWVAVPGIPAAFGMAAAILVASATAALLWLTPRSKPIEGWHRALW